jgi:hypothetical protein
MLGKSFPHLGLGLITAAALAFEIVLTRLFAVQQFYHFAFVVVSLAVMGFAVSGLLLSLTRRRPSISTLAVLFSVSVLITYTTMNALPFDSFSIAWDSTQILILALYFLTASLPFVFAGWAIGSALAQEPELPHRPYAASLVGSAAGCLFALGSLELVGGEGAIFLAISLGFGAALLSSVQRRSKILWSTLALLSAWVGFNLPLPISLNLSPYKPLEVRILAANARLTWTDWTASARIDVLESDGIHIFPGLSLNASGDLPVQAALFVDGDGPLPITSLHPNDPLAKEVAAHMPASLAYTLRPNAESLILQPGAGLDVLIALASGASKISIPSEQSGIDAVLDGPYLEYTYGLFQSPNVLRLDRSSRGVLAATSGKFDVVQFSLSDPFRPITSGAFSLTEHFPFTVEAFTDALRKTGPTGLLVITRWLGTPPSESVRIWATLIESMKRAGIQHPEQSLIAYRGMRTATVIASMRPYTDMELELTRRFLTENAFDPIMLPDLNPAELNTRNRLPEPVYHQLYSAILDSADQAIRENAFNVRPVTDNRPFFFHYFRWQQTPEVLQRLGRIWQPFGGSGYFVLLALLGLVGTMAILILFLPLVLSKHPRAGAAPTGFFAALGLGFLLIEIPLIQRLSLLYDQPTISLAVVLFGLLLFSGLGSHVSPRIPLRTGLITLVLWIGATAAAMPSIIRLALPWSLPARVAVGMIFLAPLGFLMGIPFASGLRITKGVLTSWAWAVNGALSGLAGVLAAVISLDWGFTATLMAGLLSYVLAWMLAPGLSRSI